MGRVTGLYIPNAFCVGPLSARKAQTSLAIVCANFAHEPAGSNPEHMLINKKRVTRTRFFINGAGDRIRTGDIQYHKLAL